MRASYPVPVTDGALEPPRGWPGPMYHSAEAAMKPAVIVGVILIVLGIVALAYQGITYTTREKVLEVGPIKATAEKEKTIPLPPILGGLALVGGVVLLVAATRR